MSMVLVVTPDAGLEGRVGRAFPGASLLVARTEAEGLRIAGLVDLDVVVHDRRQPGREAGSFAGRLKALRAAATVVGIGAEPDEPEGADLTVAADFAPRDLDAVVRQVAERQRLLREIAILRTQIAAPALAAGTALPSPWTPPAAVWPPPAWAAPGSAGAAPVWPALAPAIGASLLAASPTGTLLRDFARAFAAGFDVGRLTDAFLDALGGLLRPSRSALLLAGGGDPTLGVAVHRGLTTAVTAAVHLSPAEGLGLWLATHGRPALLAELTDPALARELLALGGVVAVPLLCGGDLVGILVVGQPVAGGGYGRHELELLFDLGSHLAAAIQAARGHQRLQRDHDETAQVVDHLASGVVTIGLDERIRIVNRRAEEVLGLTAATTVGQDLRALPSPLGDMLFEAMTRGEGRPRAEIQIAFRELWLEVATAPIRDRQARPVGAVLVFDDRTAQREEATRRRQAEELELVTRVLARVGDEVRNPLVSIHTFADLIEERHHDAEFRKLFASVVRRDARRLVELLDKLGGLSGADELHFATVDAHAVVDAVVSGMDTADDGLGSKPLALDVTRDAAPQLVSVDAVQLRKALAHLVRFLADRSPAEEARVSLSVGRHVDRHGAETVRIVVGSRTAAVPAERLGGLFDPVHAVQQGLAEVGPSLSQRVIEAHGGQLRVRQARQELTFHVTLPAAG